MQTDSNPYVANGTGSPVQLTFLQRVVAVWTGIIVLVASLVVMVAFLFGILVAFAERSAPAPTSVTALLATPLGRWLSIGSLGLIPIALLVGVFATLRVTRVQQSLLEADQRRNEMREQMEALRRSHNSQQAVEANVVHSSESDE